MTKDLRPNSLVVITYGFNNVLNKPFERIAEFKYINSFGNPICCPVGERDTQSSFCLQIDKGATIREATEEDKKTIFYER
jgi:hypothetical protein